MEKVALCQCGCGKIAPLSPYTNAKRGMKKGQPLRFVHGHNRRIRIENMYEIDPKTGCWNWLHGVSGNYGMIEQQTAHLFFYRKYKGELPDGLYIDHVCCNTMCVNPDHLEAVIPAVNVQRGKLAKHTVDEVLQIRSLYALGETMEDLAVRFGVTTSNIYMIVRRKSWKNIA